MSVSGGRRRELMTVCGVLDNYTEPDIAMDDDLGLMTIINQVPVSLN